jgi:hypothetical protein
VGVDLGASRYRVIGLLAQGGMGEVYTAAMQTAGMEKRVALKLVRRALDGNEEAARLFVEEARVAIGLSHANVVQSFDVGRLSLPGGSGPGLQDDRWFLAMEHVDGADLATLVRIGRERGGIPIAVAITIAVEALKGLDYAHRQRGPDGGLLGLVHRDVSPGNVLVSREGEVKIADFGIATLASPVHRVPGGAAPAASGGDGRVRGKIPYMAPEQLSGAHVDRRADVYAMGAVVYEMLSGRRAFAAEGTGAIDDVLAGRFPPLTGTDPEVAAIAHRAMAKDAAARWPSAEAMREALEAVAAARGWRLSTSDVGRLVRAWLGEGATARPPAPKGGGFDALLGAELDRVGGDEPFTVLTARPGRGGAMAFAQTIPAMAAMPPTPLEAPRTAAARRRDDGAARAAWLGVAVLAIAAVGAPLTYWAIRSGSPSVVASPLTPGPSVSADPGSGGGGSGPGASGSGSGVSPAALGSGSGSGVGGSGPAAPGSGSGAGSGPVAPGSGLGASAPGTAPGAGTGTASTGGAVPDPEPLAGAVDRRPDPDPGPVTGAGDQGPDPDPDPGLALRRRVERAAPARETTPFEARAARRERRRAALRAWAERAQARRRARLGGP